MVMNLKRKSTTTKPRILVTSISKKVPLLQELERSLKKISLSSSIVGADSDEQCIASYFINEFWHMPKLEDLSVGTLINNLIELKITGIIPTRDAELSYFAGLRELLLENGIYLMLPKLSTVNTCLDKLIFSDKLRELDYPVIPSTKNINEMKVGSFVVKEQIGSGSSSILLNADKQAALFHAKSLQDAIFQPYIEGNEYSIDVYFDTNSKFKGAVSRKRCVVINGESQVSTTVNEPDMERLCKKIGTALNLVGHAIFQIIKTADEKLHIIELNTRFGGASTLSVAAGLDSFYWFGLESVGINIDTYKFKRSQGDLKQIRYPADKIIEI